MSEQIYLHVMYPSAVCNQYAARIFDSSLDVADDQTYKQDPVTHLVF